MERHCPRGQSPSRVVAPVKKKKVASETKCTKKILTKLHELKENILEEISRISLADLKCINWSMFLHCNTRLRAQEEHFHHPKVFFSCTTFLTAHFVGREPQLPHYGSMLGGVNITY
jgi:hypothetical protein